MSKCRIDGVQLTPVMDFGDIYFSDFVDDPTDGFKSPLEIGICQQCGLVQLLDAPDPEKMYRKYWYKSGINEAMVLALADIAHKVYEYVDLKKGDTILDIGANDGTLLKFFNSHFYPGDKPYNRIGIDPAETFYEDGKKNCEHYINDFFTAENYWSVAKEKAKVITSIAMFYDLPDPVQFVRDIKECLDEQGVWIIQLSYTPLMLQQNAFDNICHEHIEYYTLTTLNNLLNNYGFKIVDLELNNVNSGSLRVYIMHNSSRKNGNVDKFYDLYDPWPPKWTLHEKMIGNFRINSLLEYEKKLNLDCFNPYAEFVTRVVEQKEATMSLLENLKQKNKLVIGYGASTKGNTLLQYYGITPDLIPYIAERTEQKWGKFTIGTGIPIISEKEMRKRKPDYLFIFPWHFVNQFKQREADLINKGTQLIVPLPTLSIQ